MRRPFQLVPSLPIFLLLSWNIHDNGRVRADPLPGILSEPLTPAGASGRQEIAPGNEQNGEGASRSLQELPGAYQDILERDVLNGLIERNPIPYPEPKAKANPQSNYYAFSGAIYIVGGNGQALNAASPAYCPAQAPQGCGNIGVWNWCCPSGCTCAWADAARSVVGCCPTGGSCSGTVDRSQITTVTVYITTTQYQQGPTVVAINGAQAAATTVVAGGQVTKTTKYNGYCTTIFAKGDNLPTTFNAHCGTGLVLNDAVRPVARQVLVSVACFWMVLGILWAGFGIRRL